MPQSVGHHIKPLTAGALPPRLLRTTMGLPQPTMEDSVEIGKISWSAASLKGEQDPFLARTFATLEMLEATVAHLVCMQGKQETQSVKDWLEAAARRFDTENAKLDPSFAEQVTHESVQAIARLSRWIERIEKNS